MHENASTNASPIVNPPEKKNPFNTSQHTPSTYYHDYNFRVSSHELYCLFTEDSYLKACFRIIISIQNLNQYLE